MNRIVSFGDSFTSGLGCDRGYTESIFNDNSIPLNERRKKANKYRRENSFTRFVADKFGVGYINNGEAGCSNKDILNNIFTNTENNKINSGDFVLIGFTSSLRDRLPFFPDNHKLGVVKGVTWSIPEIKYLLTRPQKAKSSYDIFFTEYMKFFVTEMYSEDYYSIYNQNFIILIQQYLKYNNIYYLMFDAFEHPVIKTDVYDKCHNIDLNRYWNFQNETLHSYLKKFNNRNMFELDGFNIHEEVKLHPSKLGHELFAEELFRYINKNYEY